MKAEITPDVIQDLLPLYLAGEVSADTTALVQEYLKNDSELAELVRKSAQNGSLVKEIPVPLSKERSMEAYKEAKRWMVIRTLGLAAIITFGLVCICAMTPMTVMFLMPRLP